MSKKSVLFCAFVFGVVVQFVPVAQASPGSTFAEAQRCHINETVDFGCFQRGLAKFEQFVLKDDAGWLAKSIVADGLVKTYDALHITSPSEVAVRAKETIYLKA